MRRSTDGDDLDILQKDIETFEKNKMENGGDLDAAKEREDFLSTKKGSKIDNFFASIKESS